VALFWLSDEACERSGGPTAGKGDLPPGDPPGRWDPPPSAQAKARAITLRTDG
jgi:hypothetical protein